MADEGRTPLPPEPATGLDWADVTAYARAFGAGPRTVYLAKDAPEHIKMATVLAVRRWNNLAGTAVFDIVDDKKSADIIINVEPLDEVDEEYVRRYVPRFKGDVSRYAAFAETEYKPGGPPEGKRIATKGGVVETPAPPLPKSVITLANVEARVPGQVKREIPKRLISHELAHAIGLGHSQYSSWDEVEADIDNGYIPSTLGMSRFTPGEIMVARHVASGGREPLVFDTERKPEELLKVEHAEAAAATEPKKPRPRRKARVQQFEI